MVTPRLDRAFRLSRDGPTTFGSGIPAGAEWSIHVVIASSSQAEGRLAMAPPSACCRELGRGRRRQFRPLGHRFHALRVVQATDIAWSPRTPAGAFHTTSSKPQPRARGRVRAPLSGDDTAVPNAPGTLVALSRRSGSGRRRVARLRAWDGTQAKRTSS
jgi:hypothetical protein